MFDSKTRRSMVVMPAVVALFALSACTAPSGDDKAKDGANDAAAARFVTCLNDEGQTAKIIEGGQVGLLMPDAPADSATADGGMLSLESGGGGTGMTIFSSDDEGTWIASTTADGYPEDGGLRAAWASCEEEVPEFTQPEPDISEADTEMISPEKLIDAGLAFAECARKNGFADFADPDGEGMLELPVGITEDETRTLFEACADAVEDMPPMFTQESIESAGFDFFALMSEYFDGAFAVASTMPSGSDE